MRGFGGLAAHARYFFVEERRWLDDAGFAEVYGIAQALPGPNIVGVAIILGDRYRGPAGALASAAGLCLPSLILAIALLGAIRLLPDRALLATMESAVVYATAGLVVAAAITIGLALVAERPGVRDRAYLIASVISTALLTASGALPLLVSVAIMLAAGLLFESARRARERADD